MIHGSVLDAIGGTPLLRLGKIHRPGNLVAKLEFMNPGGNVKERVAVAMIDRAEELGLLRPGGTIVEPTSGNTGVGLAEVAAVRGYRAIFTVPDKVSPEKIDLLRAYGAEVVVTPTELLPEHPDSYYAVARRLVEEIDGAYSPDQYENPANPDAHYRTTGPELWQQTEGTIRAFVAGAGTGGTLTGTSRFLKEQDPTIWVAGADPEGSIYTAPNPESIHQYLVEGVGEDFWPSTIDTDFIDEFIRVADAESFTMTRRLAREEGIVVGGSCGMAVVAAKAVAERDPDALVVVLLPDSGRGYLSKVFNDEWMQSKGFEVT